MPYWTIIAKNTVATGRKLRSSRRSYYRLLPPDAKEFEIALLVVYNGRHDLVVMVGSRRQNFGGKRYQVEGTKLRHTNHQLVFG